MKASPKETPRTINLRRPAILMVQDEPFVPQGKPGLLDEVEWRWDALCRKNPHYFDGRICHVLGVNRNGYGGAVIHVADCAYRFHAVQDEDFDLGIRSLGAKGIVRVKDKYLLGKRSLNVGAYRGLWEFAPAGIVETGQQPSQTIRAELTEETGLQSSGEPTAIAVVYDDVMRCWELVFRLVPAIPGNIQNHDRIEMCKREYDQLMWCSSDELPADLSPIATQMIPLLTS